MFQLILHHTYRKGPYAIDVSGTESDGLVTAVGYLDHGVAPGSGALSFKSPNARVRVPPKPIWKHLHALKIEVVVRIDALSARHNLVEGADSFAFGLDADGHLWGTFFGPEFKGGPPTWHGTNSATDSPDGIAKIVPVGRWVTLRFEHDGYASLRLFIDDVLVAGRYSLVAGVPAVSDAGVNIGNWTIADQYQLDGAVDEIKIWRYDPDDVLGHFLCRDFDKQSAPCWALWFDWLGDTLRDPQRGDQVIRLIRCIASVQTEVLRLVRANGEHTIGQSQRLAEEYRDLWCAGPIDGPRMLAWQKRFMKFLLETVGQEALDALFLQIRQCYESSELQAQVPESFDPVRCDPAFAGYIKGFVQLLDGQFNTTRRS